jgi:hypothetical protein
MMVRRPKADEVSHLAPSWESMLSIVSKSFRGAMVNTLSMRSRRSPFGAIACVGFELSERVPGRLLGKFQIVHVDSEAHPETGSDWNHHNVLSVQRREA